MEGLTEDVFNDIKEKIEEGKDVGVSLAQLNRMMETVLGETRQEFGETTPHTQITVDARQLKIDKVEVIKDYGGRRRIAMDDDTIEGEVSAQEGDGD